MLLNFQFLIFRKQGTIESVQKQIELWRNLVLQYCNFYNLSKFTIKQVENSNLFYNKKIESMFF